MEKIAVISAILEDPIKSQEEFNDILINFRGKIKGRMGIPIRDDITVISIILTGELDEINSLTGKLGKISGVSVKTAIGKKEI
ncbi:MAG: iron-only hydrogenase system regulator [Clostridium perfringens]|nr:iron-only hydrogenase system regulator [Clostridium perfringens]